MKKRIVLLVIAICIMTATAFAEQMPANLKLNNQNIDARYLYSEGGVDYLEARALAEVLDITVGWDEKSGIAYFFDEDARIMVSGDNAALYIDNVRAKQSPHFIQRDGKTYFPIKFFMSLFDFEVSYNQDRRTYAAMGEAIEIDETYLAEQSYSDQQLLWLARIVDVEARDGGIEKRSAVANVVLNRVEHSGFPNSIYEVIKQPGQFPPAYYDYFDSFEPEALSFEAARRALAGYNNVDNCLYFNYKPFKWKDAEDFYGEIEGDYFYR